MCFSVFEVDIFPSNLLPKFCMDPQLSPSPSYIPSPLQPVFHYPDTTTWPVINHAIPRYLLPVLATYSAHRDVLHFTELRAQSEVYKSQNSFCSSVLPTYPAHHNLHFTILTVVGDLSKSHSSSSCNTHRRYVPSPSLFQYPHNSRWLSFSLYSVIHCWRHPCYIQIFSALLTLCQSEWEIAFHTDKK